mmetsp:Transcript_75267/g.156792  ORF Transcript_75267/g.156792 Transcript_75267/m.156792 type:complete len:181 (-) Transcript_75267:537-1079(-)
MVNLCSRQHESQPQRGLPLMLLFWLCCSALTLTNAAAEECSESGAEGDRTCTAADDKPAARWASRSECEESLKAMPARRSFFQRVGVPPGADESRFRQMLARGGIHPRGVVLATEFYELPLIVNTTRLREEVDALLQGNEWEAAQDGGRQRGAGCRFQALPTYRGRGRLGRALQRCRPTS